MEGDKKGPRHNKDGKDGGKRRRKHSTQQEKEDHVKALEYLAAKIQPDQEGSEPEPEVEAPLPPKKESTQKENRKSQQDGKGKPGQAGKAAPAEPATAKKQGRLSAESAKERKETPRSSKETPRSSKETPRSSKETPRGSKEEKKGRQTVPAAGGQQNNAAAAPADRPGGLHLIKKPKHSGEKELPALPQMMVDKKVDKHKKHHGENKSHHHPHHRQSGETPKKQDEDPWARPSSLQQPPLPGSGGPTPSPRAPTPPPSDPTSPPASPATTPTASPRTTPPPPPPDPVPAPKSPPPPPPEKHHHKHHRGEKPSTRPGDEPTKSSPRPPTSAPADLSSRSPTSPTPRPPSSAPTPPGRRRAPQEHEELDPFRKSEQSENRLDLELEQPEETEENQKQRKQHKHHTTHHQWERPHLLDDLLHQLKRFERGENVGDSLAVLTKYGIPQQGKLFDLNFDSDPMPFSFGSYIRLMFSPVLRAWTPTNFGNRYIPVSKYAPSVQAIRYKGVKMKPDEFVQAEMIKAANRRKDISMEGEAEDQKHIDFLKDLSIRQMSSLPLTIMHEVLNEQIPVVEKIFTRYTNMLGSSNSNTRNAKAHHLLMKKHLQVFQFMGLQTMPPLRVLRKYEETPKEEKPFITSSSSSEYEEELQEFVEEDGGELTVEQKAALLKEKEDEQVLAEAEKKRKNKRKSRVP